MAQVSEEPKNFPARPDKTIDWLNKSRDDWKGKTQETKAELKVAKQAQRRARQSRQEWKEECRQLERRLATVVAEKNEENSNLKTKGLAKSRRPSVVFFNQRRDWLPR